MAKGVLVILDGYGEGKADKYNAVKNAKTPTLNKLKKLSHSLLKTNGDAVGLFENEMGGSEVGHTTIGAGRIVKSLAKRIRDDILSGEFQKNKKLNEVFDVLKKNKSDLHLVGLMSDKNIHSNIQHCLALIDMAKNKAKNIYVHYITDGRDSGIRDSVKYLNKLNNHIKYIENCHILSVSGRFYAMDRENNAERVNLALNAMFNAKESVANAKSYIQSQHKLGIDDQYIKPVAIKSDFTSVKSTDCVLFFNFREDRLRQIVKACEQLNCKLLTMAKVDNTNSDNIYSNEIVKNTLSEYLSSKGLKQVKISESTKYAHVTYFMNGGEEKAFLNEDRVHIPTQSVENFAATPKMRAEEITNQVIQSLNKDYDAIIVNYSNADMVGHTGDYNATVKSIEYLDKCLSRILKEAERKKYFVLVTADHGNSEEMVNSKGEPNTAHTKNRVFCVVANRQCKMKRLGELKDVAPTFVELMELPKNKFFKGESLII